MKKGLLYKPLFSAAAPDQTVSAGIVLQPLLRQRVALLCRVKAGLFVGLPVAQVASEQTIFAKQQLIAAFPGTEFEQAAVAPQVVDGLNHDVSDEGNRHVMKNANAPFFVAAQGFVNIKGRAAVLGFFGSMPLPHGSKAWLCAFKNFRVA